MNRWQRKAAIPFGAQKEVQEESGYSMGFISEVANGKASPTDDARVVAELLAAKANRVPHRLFPEYCKRSA